MQYTALFIRDKDAGGYTVRVPALSGCITEGDTLLEALENTKEAILAYLESLARDNLAAPEDRAIVELYEDEEEAWVLKIPVEETISVA